MHVCVFSFRLSPKQQHAFNEKWEERNKEGKK
jgi:hypothetical protein